MLRGLGECRYRLFEAEGVERDGGVLVLVGLLLHGVLLYACSALISGTRLRALVAALLAKPGHPATLYRLKSSFISSLSESRK